MLNFFDILPNSMQVKDTQHLQHLGAFLQNSFSIQQTSNLRKVVLSTLKEDYFLMQLKSTELLLTISSLFKKNQPTFENSEVCFVEKHTHLLFPLY